VVFQKNNPLKFFINISAIVRTFDTKFFKTFNTVCRQTCNVPVLYISQARLAGGGSMLDVAVANVVAILSALEVLFAMMRYIN